MKHIIYVLFLLNITFAADKVFVACEGSFGQEDGQIWTIDNDLVYPYDLNPIGSLAQSVAVYENKLLVGVNASYKLLLYNISDSGLSFEAEILTDGLSPREIVIVDNKAYISVWDPDWYVYPTEPGYIKVLNLENLEIEASIEVGIMPEDMIFHDNYLWVANSGESSVMKIDVLSNSIAQSLEVGQGPTNLAGYDGDIYVSRTFYDSNWNTFYGTSKIDVNDAVLINDYGSGVACGGGIYKYQDSVYRTFEGGIARIDENLNIIPESRLGSYGSFEVYSAEVIGDNIYFGLSDYVSPDYVAVVNSLGEEIYMHEVGGLPGDFVDWVCVSDGDINHDGSLDVSDIIVMVSNIVNQNSFECILDIDSNSIIDIIDIILSIQSIVNGRDGAPASSVEFIRTSQGLEMNADGVVDAVQLTLSHGDNFSIELTDNAFVAEYSTKDNQTTLMVVAPEGNEIFTASGEYTIDEMIAANKDGYVPTSQPVSFNLSEAYPNPFNPSTSLEISLNVASNVSITAYNVMGQLVSTIHDGNMDAGTHAITWNASNVASGMYIIKAEAAGKVINQKVMLLK